MMKIAFLEEVRSYGGARRTTVDIVAGLSRHHDAYIIDIGPGEKTFLEDCEAKSIKVERPIISAIGTLGTQSFLSKVKNVLATRSKLKSLLKKKGPDLIVVNSFKLLYLTPSTVPITFFFRGWCLKREISNYRLNYIVRRSSYFLTNSNPARSVFIGRTNISPSKVYTIPNSIQPLNLPINKNPSISNLSIVVCGGFLPTKGHFEALALFKEIHESNTSASLTLVGHVYPTEGSKQFLNQLKEYIRENALTSSVKIISNHPDARLIIAQSDYMLHFSDTEGMPRVVMEAMQARTIVIAYPAGGTSDLIKTGFSGFLVATVKPRLAIKIIEKLENDTTLKETILTNAERYITIGHAPEIQLDAFENAMLK